MIKGINDYGLEQYECSKCGASCTYGDDYCQTCGRWFQYPDEQTSVRSDIDNHRILFSHQVVNKDSNDNHFAISNDWLNFEMTAEEKNFAFKLLKKVRPDSFFYYFFGLIYLQNYKSSVLPLILKSILTDFQEGLVKLLKENVMILVDSRVSPDREFVPKFQWKRQFDNFGKDLQFFIDAAKDVINYNPDRYFIFGVQPGGNPYSSPNVNLFVQNLMLISASLAFQRLHDEIDNEEYFGIEIFHVDNEEELILYLTPHGLVERLSGTSVLSKPKENFDEIITLLNDIGIQKINVPVLNTNYKANSFIVFNNKLYYQYLEHDENISEYIATRNNVSFLTALFRDGQINFRPVC